MIDILILHYIALEESSYVCINLHKNLQAFIRVIFLEIFPMIARLNVPVLKPWVQSPMVKSVMEKRAIALSLPVSNSTGFTGLHFNNTSSVLYLSVWEDN